MKHIVPREGKADLLITANSTMPGRFDVLKYREAMREEMHRGMLGAEAAHSSSGLVEYSGMVRPSRR